MKNHIVFLLCFLTISLNISGQSNLVPVYNSVYDFLERMTVKDVINFNSFVKPIERKEIAKYLQNINTQNLSSIEVEEYDWYKREFYDELNDDQIVERWNLFHYKDSVFSFTFNPIFDLKISQQFEESQLKRYWGFSFYGNIANNFSFQGDFRDNWEKGDNLDREYKFNSQTGPIILKATGNTMEYSETRGALLYSNDWLTFGAVKELINVGSGYRSQLVLSEKSPSFPSIFLKINPVDWLQFYYMHGWLLSRVEDSLSTYKTFIEGRDRRIYRDKYFVMHALQINPYTDVSINIGETVIYSDNGVYFGYLIPFLFFRSVDHMFEGGGGGNAGNNGSIFMDVNYRFLSKFKTYFSLFIDELSLADLLGGDTDRNQFAFSWGLSAYDFGISNLGVKVEYTRILPWVYSNFVQTQTYTNSNYLLGHYIGQNADQLFLQLDYRLMRGLEFKLWGEMIRQGGFDDVSKQYTDPGEAFLYGLRRNETNVGFEVRYEYINDLFAKVSYVYSEVEDEDGLRTPFFMLGSKHSFSVGFYYGL